MKKMQNTDEYAWLKSWKSAHDKFYANTNAHEEKNKDKIRVKFKKEEEEEEDKKTMK